LRTPAVVHLLFGAGLVVFSGFRKKIRKKTYHVSAKSGGLAQAAIYR